jgi:hypothetical protein
MSDNFYIRKSLSDVRNDKDGDGKNPESYVSQISDTVLQDAQVTAFYGTKSITMSTRTRQYFVKFNVHTSVKTTDLLFWVLNILNRNWSLVTLMWESNIEQ